MTINNSQKQTEEATQRETEREAMSKWLIINLYGNAVRKQQQQQQQINVNSKTAKYVNHYRIW